MGATIIISIIFIGIIIWAFKRTRDDIKSNTCACCSANCSNKIKKNCNN